MYWYENLKNRVDNILGGVTYSDFKVKNGRWKCIKTRYDPYEIKDLSKLFKSREIDVSDLLKQMAKFKTERRK